MKNKKLKLNALKVQSFVTAMQDKEKNTIHGQGSLFFPCETEGCPTRAINCPITDSLQGCHSAVCSNLAKCPV